ncbi:hypothetical protein RND81_08G218800 [Saponaria officinalis]|uniref:Uncharacterized protein n=1 Tax=Saponaria officinalis TaxID=3572 RepID=A0AAW1JAT2_SAPOF
MIPNNPKCVVVHPTVHSTNHHQISAVHFLLSHNKYLPASPNLFNSLNLYISLSSMEFKLKINSSDLLFSQFNFMFLFTDSCISFDDLSFHRNFARFCQQLYVVN